MPFKSEAQRRFFQKNLPEHVAKWEKETPKGKLPDHVKPKQQPFIKKRGRG